MIEIRWHGRAGQGAKTASQLLALGLMRSGLSVQAFPEYGPERSGAPMRAYTRLDTRQIRRRYGVTGPDVVAVLDASVVGEVDVTSGLGEGGTLLINTERAPEQMGGELGYAGNLGCVPADRLAEETGAGFVNVVMAGAVAAVIDQPPLDALQSAARELFGAKLAGGSEEIEQAIAAGHRSISEELVCPV